MNEMSRGTALRWLAAGAGLSLLAACGPSMPGAPASGTTTVGQPTPGGTLRVGMVGDLTALEGQLIIPGALNTLWQIYDRLIAYDDKTQPQPMLAERWELAPDGTQITLHLRKGVQFHSGRELTSEDIRANVVRAQNPKPVSGNLWWSYSVGQTGFKDPSYEQLVTSIGTEPYGGKRSALYGQLNDFLLDQSFAMVVSPQPSRLLARANVQGIRFFRHEAVDYSATWLA